MVSEHARAAAVFAAVFFYFVGLLLVDLGATLRIAGGHTEALLVSAMEPRVTYHAGILSQITGFFILYAVAISYFVELNGIRPHQEDWSRVRR